MTVCRTPGSPSDAIRLRPAKTGLLLRQRVFSKSSRPAGNMLGSKMPPWFLTFAHRTRTNHDSAT